MAEVIVSPIVQVLLDNLSSLIHSEVGLMHGVRKDCEKLSNTLSIVRLVLRDAEEKQIRDKSTRDWLRKLKDAAYDADDILDECAFEVVNSDDMSCSEQVSYSIFTCLDFKRIMLSRQHEMGKRIKDLIEKFDEIAGERSKFHFSLQVVDSTVEEFVRSRETSSMSTEPQIYGRDGDKERIVELLLCNASSPCNLSICPVLGIGGLGKTTLAQLVYNDERVVKQFDAKIWVCVSEDFGVKRLTKMIIESLSGSSCELVDLNTMQIRLRQLLNGNKYLLVLDDVWSEDANQWNNIRFLLTCGERGSSAIVTTRLPTVVQSMTCLQTGTSSFTCSINPTYILGGLLEHDCLDLFKHHAIGTGKEGSPILVEIGQEIVKKCGGVPLAVKALGSLLYSKQEEFWQLVRDSEIWSLQEYGENIILPSLRLSYKHLPPLFRQCFAYCSVYPKDCLLDKEELIHQWMANGFIQSSRTREVEDIGCEIFNELLRRSFFQYMNEAVCTMHDLMHDLACSVMENEFSSMQINTIKNIPQRVRHVSMQADLLTSPKALSTISKSWQPLVRTLLFNPSDVTNGITLDVLSSRFSKLRCLRALDLGCPKNITSVPPWFGHLKHLRYLNISFANISPLPKSICSLRNLQVLVLRGNHRLATLPPSIRNLKNLRCLDLSFTGITVIPESVCCLTNLQTLKLIGCGLEMLPREMRNIRGLRHLEIEGYNRSLRGMPVGIGELTRLETLNLFVVGPSNTNNGQCGAGIQEMERLNQLRGNLTIQGLRNVLDPKNAQAASLISKRSLSKLSLIWSVGVEEGDVDSDEENIRRSQEVLERLRPHPNLLELDIHEYPGVVFPSWVLDSAAAFRNLQQLIVTDVSCSGRERQDVGIQYLKLPACLKKLTIIGCPKLRLPTTELPSSIEELEVDGHSDPTLASVETLPHLSSLVVWEFNEQENLPEAPLANLCCLKNLGISSCKKLKQLPTMQLGNLATLKRLEIKICGELDSIPEEGLRSLTSLENLVIFRCPRLKSLSLPLLEALESLLIRDCPDLKISVLHFQHLVSLRYLTLQDLPQLIYLPEGIQNLITLRGLDILDCKNLRKLPARLPPTLVQLYISNCHPDLHETCHKDKGEYWHKISHLHVYNVGQS